MNSVKEITLEQFVEAMAKNGWPKTQHKLVRWNKTFTKPVAACAIGQAALNLKLDPYHLGEVLADTSPTLYRRIVGLNDDTDTTISEIAQIAKSLIDTYNLGAVTLEGFVYDYEAV